MATSVTLSSGKTITPRNLFMDAKNHLTPIDLCGKYHIEQKELDGALKRLFFSERARAELMSKLDANQQLREKQARNDQRRQRNAKKQAEKNDTIRTLDEIHEAEDKAEAKIAENIPKSPIELLEEQKISLEGNLQALRDEYIETTKHYRGLTLKLEESASDLETVVTALQKSILKYQNRLALCRECEQKLRDILSERDSARNELADLQQKIESLATVTFCGYENGEFEIVDCTGIPESNIDANSLLDGTGCEELFATLTDHPECENLRMKDIRLLSRALQIATRSPWTIEFLFDTPELEEAYAILSQELLPPADSPKDPPRWDNRGQFRRLAHSSIPYPLVRRSPRSSLRVSRSGRFAAHCCASPRRSFSFPLFSTLYAIIIKSGR